MDGGGEYKEGLLTLYFGPSIWLTNQCGSQIQRKEMITEYPGRNGKHSQTNGFINFREKGRI